MYILGVPALSSVSIATAWTTNRAPGQLTRIDRRPETKPGLRRSQRKDRQRQRLSNGRRFELVAYNCAWGEDRVYFHNEEQHLIALPAKPRMEAVNYSEHSSRSVVLRCSCRRRRMWSRSTAASRVPGRALVRDFDGSQASHRVLEARVQ